MNMKPFLSLLVITSLAACSMQEGDFPSLAKRPFEENPNIEEPLSPEPQVIAALPGPLQAAVDQAVAKSNTAHRKFLKNLPSVKSRVNAARGSAVSSESWVVAQMDLAALEISRSPSVAALADIDEIYLDRLNSEFEAASPGGAAIIATKRDQIAVQVEGQQDEIDAMKVRLR